jgi:GNAT superfamily N-acetyltransferase
VIVPQISTQTATADDIEALLANLRAGFETYVEFAPAGWQPPEPQPDKLLTPLAENTTWALLATVDGGTAGHVAFTPSRGNPFEDPGGWREAPANPGEAHLWQLFVLPQHWGHGVAGLLHTAALEEMSTRDYQRARLFTPAGNARARRFYERRGWLAGRALHDPDLGLELVEYRVELSPRPKRPAPRRP